MAWFPIMITTMMEVQGVLHNHVHQLSLGKSFKMCMCLIRVALHACKVLWMCTCGYMHGGRS